MSSPFLIKDHDLVLGYGQHDVLGPLQGHYKMGERWILIGANGAGKSTFLKSIVEPELRRGGTRQVMARAAYLGQKPLSTDGLPCSAEDFLLASMGLSLGQDPMTSDHLRRLEDVLLRTGLRSIRDRRIDRLSGGQAQRLAFARALLLDCPILLLDEPFSAVDPESRQSLRHLLDEMLPRTLQFLVLHDPVDVAAGGGRVIRVTDGQLQILGPEEVAGGAHVVPRR